MTPDAAVATAVAVPEGLKEEADEVVTLARAARALLLPVCTHPEHLHELILRIAQLKGAEAPVLRLCRPVPRPHEMRSASRKSNQIPRTTRCCPRASRMSTIIQ